MVRLVEEIGKSPVQVAKDLGVNATSVRRWVKQYGSQGKDSFPGKGNLHPADEKVQKRDKSIKNLEEENAILIKAVSIFAKGGDKEFVYQGISSRIFRHGNVHCDDSQPERIL